MEKKIEDYLHFYLWNEVINPQGQKFTVYGIDPRKKFIQNIVGENTVSLDFLKLILRPLLDMTEEEQKDFEATKVFVKATPVHHVGNMQWTPETFRWLLSKGFDIFGLIEAGLALDKTTL